MPEAKNNIAALIADSVNNTLSLSGERQLKEWSDRNPPNNSLLLALSKPEERNKRLARYRTVESELIWNKIRQKAKQETGYEIGSGPVELPRFSPAIRALLISITVITVMGIAAIIYVSVSGLRGKQAPGRTVQKSNYRF